ncbi:MAG: hypothetical protein DGJ47_000021 [Rickettsiaceae bacterium]
MASDISFTNRRSKVRKVKNEINVTPMVDVMLVLLIIFMITSPMLVAGIEVDLPKTKSSPATGDTKPLVLSIDAKGDIYLFQTKIPQKSLILKLKEVTKENNEAKIFVKGDRRLAYGKIVQVISHVKTAGFTKVALVSDIEN